MQKILIVEDDIDIQDILKNHLIDAGYEVAVASDGVAGIAMFDDTIDLLLLDIMLPKIDGYGVCEVIRKRSQVPIIMLTALSDEENQLRGFEQQIDDYIHHHAVVVLHAAVRAHSVDLAFLIADDADLLLKGVERLDQTAHYFLHPGKGCVDLGSAGELARFQQYHLDFLAHN